MSTTYQWYYNGNIISGANSSTYTIPATSSSNIGSYYVLVNNSISSNNATINVINITSQPESQTVLIGSSVGFSVTTSDTSDTSDSSDSTTSSYQWYYNNEIIEDAISSTYTIPSTLISNIGSYYVVITDSYGSLTSSSATLSVIEITTQPESQIINSGSSVTFSITTSGSTPTYQWYYNNSAISGATSNTYTISSTNVSNAGNYYVLLNNSVSSDNAILSIINISPTSQIVNIGSTVTFTTTVYGITPIYQWYYNNEIIPNATLNTYTVSSVDSSNTGNYYVLLNNSVSSTVVTLNIVTINPPSQTVNTGSSVTLSAIIS